MENQTDKVYKTKSCVRKAVKKYTEGLKEKNPEKYKELLIFHRAYNKEYYRKLKEDRARLTQMLEQNKV